MSNYAKDFLSGATTGNGETDADGFTRTLHFYQRGPNDPPGNGWIWMCRVCDQVKPKGHAPDCPHLRDTP